MTAGNDTALIIFSRLPIGHETKTRLAGLLNETQRAELHLAMWHDIFTEALKLRSTDIYLYWTGSGNAEDYQEHIPPSFILRKQEGNNLGERMKNALREIFADGYKRAAIIGADIPSVRAGNIARAFDLLNDSDIVIGPSKDGGYWLIGMNKFVPDAFNVSSWGNSSVLSSTSENLTASNISYSLAETLQDIDTPEDISLFTSDKRNSDRSAYTYLKGCPAICPRSIGD